MQQFVPNVSEEDVDRILKRDFPAEQKELLQIIQQIQVTERSRVVLACMKNANKDIKKLKYNLQEASGYYREHIGEAESPNYIKKVFQIEKLSEDERNKIIEKDKEQYLIWLNKI
jgi:hypothetical protein